MAIQKQYPSPIQPPGSSAGVNVPRPSGGVGAPQQDRQFSAPNPGAAMGGRPASGAAQAPAPAGLTPQTIQAPQPIAQVTDPRAAMLARTQQSYGQFPGQGQGAMPQPQIVPGRYEFNPHTGAWVTPDGRSQPGGTEEKDFSNMTIPELAALEAEYQNTLAMLEAGVLPEQEF